MSDIIERLRENAGLDEMEHGNPDVVALEREAADTIDQLRARIAELEAQLNDALTAVDDEQHKADSMRDYCRELEAQQRAGVPDGWKLVPVEPTPEMFAAANASARSEYAMLGLTDASRIDATKAAGNYYRAMLAAAPSPEGQEAECSPAPAEGQAGDEWRLHPDDLAVDRMAAAMKEKLAKKREQGRGGWEDKEQCSAEYLSQLLIEHVAKGDPIDVANFAMMLHQRGERITAAAQPAPGVTHPSAEPVGTVRFALGVPSSLYGELDVPLEPGTKLYARPVPAPADEAVRLLADIKAWDVSQYLSLPLHLRKRIQAAIDAQPKRSPYNASGSLSEYGVFPECDAQQPAEGEEIMVNTPYDVFILPLRPSGLDGKGPRFVVHVPGPEQPAPQAQSSTEAWRDLAIAGAAIVEEIREIVGLKGKPGDVVEAVRELAAAPSPEGQEAIAIDPEKLRVALEQAGLRLIQKEGGYLTLEKATPIHTRTAHPTPAEGQAGERVTGQPV